MGFWPFFCLLMGSPAVIMVDDGVRRRGTRRTRETCGRAVVCCVVGRGARGGVARAREARAARVGYNQKRESRAEASTHDCFDAEKWQTSNSRRMAKNTLCARPVDPRTHN